MNTGLAAPELGKWAICPLSQENMIIKKSVELTPDNNPIWLSSWKEI